MTMMGSAVVLTNGWLDTVNAKTAHGLIRGTSRFEILGVVDQVCAGRDAGEVLDGKFRNIPVFSDIDACIAALGKKPDYAVVGVAVSGGRLPENWEPLLLEVIARKISLVCGLHQQLATIPALRDAAREQGVDILDIRKPKTLDELNFWKGEIFGVRAPRVAVLGMDCALGKRTTCRFLMEACRAADIKAEMIFTGQTGWLQGGKYGFIFDSTLNDFVSGELERAIVDCDRETSPDLILIEGQSGLRNPSGPCGSEFLVSGQAKGVVLVAAPFLKYYEELEEFDCRTPDVRDEIALIKMYGAETLAVALNGEGGSPGELAAVQGEWSDRLGIPVIRPLVEGVEGLLPVLRGFIKQHKKTDLSL
ncbi:MAG: DUF1611 domain-containing protein [Pseudomonadota bacterium]